MALSTVLAMVLVGAGVALMATGMLARVLRREDELAGVLDLPYGEQDVPIASVVEQHGTLVESTIGLAGKLIEQVDARGGLYRRIERARLSLRPGELVLIAAAAGTTFAVLAALLTHHWVAAVVVLALTPVVTNLFLGWRIARRSRRFAEQFPDALSLIASSLHAGHTFLRSIQLMQQESDGPLADEFARVVSETQLGSPLVDALERMGDRVHLRDVDWVVQAIRIQQQVGGKLADLLATLADFIRAREEVRREIDVLTAEGRISAWVLGALPVFLFVAVSILNPGYLDPMLRGWGPVWLAITALAMVSGVGIILRMVKQVEV